MNRKYMDFVPTNAAKKVKKPAEAEDFVEKPTKVVEKVKEEPKAEPDKAKVTRPLPKPAFVNTEKISKRPLSKNVYQKKLVSPKEEVPSAPVTIINKPEKDSKVGLIVTIIITIILGAAAGTVAFLLLPK